MLSYSHQTVWLEAAADATVFVFGLVSPALSSPQPPRILSALAARALGVCVFKKLKNVPREREVEALACATCELLFFF